MNDVLDRADAVVMAWLPGTEGAGLADVLFGRMPFTASLPVAWPGSVDHVPSGIDKPIDSIRFPVGHGLQTG